MVRPSAVITPMTRLSQAAPAMPASPDGAPTHAGPMPSEPDSLDFATVIRSKIRPPALRPDTLTRERLVKRLDEALASRVVFLVADAGYGKTTLLADYLARAGLRSLWYRLGRSDADAVTWTNHLVAACREVDPSFGTETSTLLKNTTAGNPSDTALLNSFLGEMGRWPDAPTVLVLDDFHEVDNNLEIAEIIGRLINDGPDWLHIIMSGRRRPQLAVGRLAAAAQLAEIRAEELRFSVGETRRLFAESYSQPLDVDVLNQLDRRAKGWAAGLQLFHGSIRGRPAADIRRLAESMSGASGPIYDFLAEEVLANVPDELAHFLVRASLLERIVAAYVPPLLDSGPKLGPQRAQQLIEESTELGLLGRTGDHREGFEMHPLLRDFLARQLNSELSHTQIRAIHERLAVVMSPLEPLSACHHFIEAGLENRAMALLGTSVMTALGSGQWGVASSLIERLRAFPADPAVAALRARHLTDSGNPAAAARLLMEVDPSGSAPDVRAVVRQAWFSIGWRTGDRELMRTTLAEILGDPDTPRVLRDFAEIFADAGSVASDQAKPLPSLGRRLVQMADQERREGHWFFSGISFHNACCAFLNAGDYANSLETGEAALESFRHLGYQPVEATATHSVLATCLFELGRNDDAFKHAEHALNGQELADVPAELAVAHAALGLRSKALEYLGRAETLTREGRTDTGAAPLVDWARAAVALPDHPREAVALLQGATADALLDLGQVLHRRIQLAVAYFLAGNVDACLEVALAAADDAHKRSERRAEVRLDALLAIANGDSDGLRQAISEAWSASRLALPELADVICEAGRLVDVNDESLALAIRHEPARWLPALRRQLGKGAPDGLQAAILLDTHGEFEDVARLRAYAKAYRRRGASVELGINLARRTSPRMVIQDLGRVYLTVGGREVPVSGMRRKAAALLMYLATQPALTANKEQVLDALWPDADPASATNSLNQSLYFLRREIDPWYEDGFSVDYIAFAGDLVWLDRNLVSTESAEFLRAAAAIRSGTMDPSKAVDAIRGYRGQFAPEFEYEEWAMDWRSKVHSVLLDLAHAAIERLTRGGDLSAAREVAIGLLDIDPSASDIERRLIWLLWQGGARSAAKAQYEHLARLEARDGFDVQPFDDIVQARQSG